MKQEAVGVSEFQRMVSCLFFYPSSRVRLYPSSRLLVVAFHPVSTLRQTIPIFFWAMNSVSSRRFLYTYRFGVSSSYIMIFKGN